MFCSFHCTRPSPSWLSLLLFLFFDVVVNEVLLFSILGYSLLVYRNANGFYMLIFIFCCFAEFIYSNVCTCAHACVCVYSLRFLVYKIVLCANRDNLTSFPIWIPFISLSCLNAWWELPFLHGIKVVNVTSLPCSSS